MPALIPAACLLLFGLYFISPQPIEVEPAPSPIAAAEDPAFDCTLVVGGDANVHVKLSGEGAQLVSLRVSDGRHQSQWRFASEEFQ